ncbi:MAG: DsbA family protein [Acidobacteriota bacterium]
MKFLCLLAIAALSFAQAPTVAAARSALDKPTLEAYLRHMELWIPQVSVAIDDPKPSLYLKGFSEVIVHLSYNGQGKDERYYVSADGRNIVKGEPYDITKNPFQANLDKIKTDLQPSFGTAGAPVVLVVFGDFECPYCKGEAEVLRNNVVQTFGQQVRVYFKDFPLEAIHPWARAGSIAGRCVFRQNALNFWKFHDWIYSIQQEVTPENLTAKVLKWGEENGVDAAQLSRCMETKATDAEVTRNLEEGRSLGISATPTTFLNGRKLEGSVEWPVLQQLINLELNHQVTAKDAGEKCCEVNIPTLLPGAK